MILQDVRSFVFESIQSSRSSFDIGDDIQQIQSSDKSIDFQRILSKNISSSSSSIDYRCHSTSMIDDSWDSFRQNDLSIFPFYSKYKTPRFFLSFSSFHVGFVRRAFNFHAQLTSSAMHCWTNEMKTADSYISQYSCWTDFFMTDKYESFSIKLSL